MPAKTLQTPAEGREYVARLTARPLQSYWAIPRFLRFTRQIQRQLQGSPGLLGYSLLARPWRLQFWTLSVWEDEQALTAFVSTDPHRGVMGALQPDSGPTRFTRWPLRAEECPPSWDAAFSRAAAPIRPRPPRSGWPEAFAGRDVCGNVSLSHIGASERRQQRPPLCEPGERLGRD